MASVHYFQRYSQRENVDTNNTLLLLSRVNAEDPRLLRDLLSALFSNLNAELDVGVQFSQQSASPSGGVPDGIIHQSSFRLVLETKRASTFSQDQLVRHLGAFGPESAKVLLLLAPERVVVSLPEAQEARIQVVSRSFSDLITACRTAGLHANATLREVVDDYEQYCQESNLLASESQRLLVVPVGTTLSDNLDLRLYYAPAARGFQKHAFLGLYSRKRVQAIGQVENVIAADLNGGQFVVHHSSHPVTPEQAYRIQQAIAAAPQHGYDIAIGHSFFLVTQFSLTDFAKTSSGGLFGKRYFNLREELDLGSGSNLPTIAQIAEALRQRTWE